MDIHALYDSMTLEQRIGQMFLHDFVGKEDLSPELAEKAEQGLLGGIIFFSGANVEDIHQLRRLTDRIQAHAAGSSHGIPVLISLDQEGGQLSALHRGVNIFPGNMAMGLAGDEALVREAAAHIGSELAHAGIGINFAPVLDVAYDARSGVPVGDNRMFASDPALVSAMGRGFVEGLHRSGIMACGKHFPGQRLTERDTHHALDRIDYSKERLEQVELRPFREAIACGLDAVMTHHAIYEAFEDVPATLSPVLNDYLRREMGFEGLVISDDLIMKAVMELYSPEDAVVRAINAGVDLIIFTGAGKWFIPEVARAVADGRIPERRIRESVLRILAAKAKYFFAGVVPDAAVKEAPQQAELWTRPQAGEPSYEQGREINRKLSSRALVRYSGEPGLFPLRPAEGARVSVLLANPARLVMSDTVNFYDISLKAVIEEQGILPYVKEAVMPWTPCDEEVLSCFDIGFISDILIFTTVNAHRFTRQLEILKQIREATAARQDKKTLIIGVATRSPNDAPLLAPYCDGVIVTGGLTPQLVQALVQALFVSGDFPGDRNALPGVPIGLHQSPEEA